MNDFKIIAPSINRTNDRKIIWSFTKKDLIFSFVLLIFFSIIWIPLLITNNLIPAMIIIFLSIFIASIFNIKLHFDKRVYQMLFLLIKFLSKKKYTNIKIIKVINNNEITFVNNSKVKIFRIIGKDTSFISDHEFDSISQGLREFFNISNNSIQIIKIDGKIDLDSQMNLLNKYKNQNINKNKEISNLENFIYTLKNNQSTSTQAKYFLVVPDNKNIDYIETNFSRAKIVLKEAVSKEIEEIKENIFLNNKSYIENISNFYNQEENEFTSFCAIKKLPIKAYKQWLSFVLNYQDVDISFSTKNWDKEKAIKKIDNILLLNFEKLQNQNDSKLIQSQLIEETFNETLKQIEINQDSLKLVSIVIKFKSNSKKQLNYKIRKFVKEAIKNNYEIDRLWFLQEIGLKSFISFNNLENKNHLIGVDCLSSVLGYGYPFIQQELIDANGIVLGIDENDTPIAIDWKYRNNYKPSSSTILIGQTGSGKTTTAKRIIKNQIISNQYKIFVIDPENEYGDLIENLGGERINLLNKNFLINPFALNPNNNLEEQINNKISFLTTFFQLIFNNLLLHNDILNLISACFDLYQKNKINEWTFTDLKKYITKLRFKETIINVINQYCDGKAFGNLFDHRTKLNFNNDYVCFEFKEIISKSSGEIAKAQIFLVLQYLNEQILNTNKEKYLNVVLDEAHLLLDEKYIEISQYLCEMYKRIRKYNGMMLIATQNISDFYTKKAILPYTLPIINNSFYIIIHSIKPQEIEDLNLLMKEVGGINDQERKFLIDSSCGNAILFFKNVRTKIKVNP